ncbi:MAG: MarR family winged helix-turn-helix transcriptional regulator [Eubacteriales bacterium]|nr:MarR family winged helix-turn-helix transcriptional regulator [Eubacteriales bacterium]
MNNNWPYIMHRITQIARRIHDLLRLDCKRGDLSVTEHHIVMELFRLGMDCGYDELIEATCFKSTISRGVVNLEKKGFVISYFEPEDANRKRAKIQPNGISYAETNIKNAVELEKNLYGNFSKKEVDQLHQYLLRFYNNLRGIEKEDIPFSEWPVLGHYTMNILKYMEYSSPIFQNEGREANQKHILLSLLHQEGECSYKKIERKFHIPQTVVVRQMKKLCDLGYAETYTLSDDHRKKAGKLTGKGVEEAKIILDVFVRSEDMGSKGFSMEEKESFRILLYKVLVQLDSILS